MFVCRAHRRFADQHRRGTMRAVTLFGVPATQRTLGVRVVATPVTVSLPDPPGGKMPDAVRVLSRWIDPSELRLGGGIVLAARWHHRNSTDLDFLATGDAIDTLFYQDLDGVLQDMVNLAKAGVIGSETMRETNRTVLHFDVGGTPVSIGRVGFHDDLQREVESRTNVLLSPTRDILTKKMVNRFLVNGLPTERDAFDFLVAQTKAPEDLKYAWLQVPAPDRNTLAAAYRERSLRWTGASDARLLANLAYAELANELWLHAHRMMESNLEYVPIGSAGKGSHER